MTNLISSVLLRWREVFPAVALDFAAAGTFQIHDAPDARIDRRNVQRAAGFEQHGKAVVAERLHQRQGIFLQERFAAGQFDQRQADAGGDVRQTARPIRSLAPEFPASDIFFPFGKGVGGVAVGTAQIAGRQTDENTGQTGPGAFALHAQINFIDDQRVRHPGNLRFGVCPLRATNGGRAGRVGGNASRAGGVKQKGRTFVRPPRL